MELGGRLLPVPQVLSATLVVRAELESLATAQEALGNVPGLGATTQHLSVRGAFVALSRGDGSSSQVIIRRLHSADLPCQLVRVGDGSEVHPLAAVLPGPPTAQQWREACRELAGRLLRGEAEHVTAPHLRSMCERLAVLQRCVAELPAPGAPMGATRRKALEGVLAACEMDAGTWELWRQELGKWRWDAERAAELAATGGPVDPRPELLVSHQLAGPWAVGSPAVDGDAAEGGARTDGGGAPSAAAAARMDLTPQEGTDARDAGAGLVSVDSPGCGTKRGRGHEDGGDRSAGLEPAGKQQCTAGTELGGGAHLSPDASCSAEERPCPDATAREASWQPGPMLPRHLRPTERYSRVPQPRSQSPSPGGPGRSFPGREGSRDPVPHNQTVSTSGAARASSADEGTLSRDQEGAAPQPPQAAADAMRAVTRPPQPRAGGVEPPAAASGAERVAGSASKADAAAASGGSSGPRSASLTRPRVGGGEAGHTFGHAARDWVTLEAWAEDVHQYLMATPHRTRSWVDIARAGYEIPSKLRGDLSLTGFLYRFGHLWTLSDPNRPKHLPLELTAVPPEEARRNSGAEVESKWRTAEGWARDVHRHLLSQPGLKMTWDELCRQAHGWSGFEVPLKFKPRHIALTRFLGAFGDLWTLSEPNRAKDQPLELTAIPPKQSAHGAPARDWASVEAWAEEVYRYLLTQPDHTAEASALRYAGLGVPKRFLPSGRAVSGFLHHFPHLWTVGAKDACSYLRITAVTGAQERTLRRRAEEGSQRDRPGQPGEAPREPGPRDGTLKWPRPGGDGPSPEAGSGRRPERMQLRRTEWPTVEAWAADVYKYLLKQRDHTAPAARLRDVGLGVPAKFLYGRTVSGFLHGAVFQGLWVVLPKARGTPLSIAAVPGAFGPWLQKRAPGEDHAEATGSRQRPGGRDGEGCGDRARAHGGREAGGGLGACDRPRAHANAEHGKEEDDEEEEGEARPGQPGPLPESRTQASGSPGGSQRQPLEPETPQDRPDRPARHLQPRSQPHPLSALAGAEVRGGAAWPDPAEALGPEARFVRELVVFLDRQHGGTASLQQLCEHGLRIPREVLAGRKASAWLWKHQRLWVVSDTAPIRLTLRADALETHLSVRGAFVALSRGDGSSPEVIIRRIYSADLSRQLVRADGGSEVHPLAAVLPGPPTAQQWREACRELAGRLLRGEAEHMTAAELRSVCERLAVLQRCAAELPAPGQPLDATRRKALEAVLAAPVMDEPTWELWRGELDTWRWDAERAAQLAATGGPVEPRPQHPACPQHPTSQPVGQAAERTQANQTSPMAPLTPAGRLVRAAGTGSAAAATRARAEEGATVVLVPSGTSAGPPAKRQRGGSSEAADAGLLSPGPACALGQRPCPEAAAREASWQGGLPLPPPPFPRPARRLGSRSRSRSRSPAGRGRSRSPTVSRSRSRSRSRDRPTSRQGRRASRCASPSGAHPTGEGRAGDGSGGGHSAYCKGHRDWQLEDDWAEDVHRFLQTQPVRTATWAAVVSAGLEIPPRFKGPHQSLTGFLYRFRRLWTLSDPNRPKHQPLELTAVLPGEWDRDPDAGPVDAGQRWATAADWARDVQRFLLSQPGHKMAWVDIARSGLDISTKFRGTLSLTGFLYRLQHLWTLSDPHRPKDQPLELTAIPPGEAEGGRRLTGTPALREWCLESWAQAVYRYALLQPGNTVALRQLNKAELGVPQHALAGRPYSTFLYSPAFEGLWQVLPKAAGQRLSITAIPGALDAWLGQRRGMQAERGGSRAAGQPPGPPSPAGGAGGSGSRPRKAEDDGRAVGQDRAPQHAGRAQEVLTPHGQRGTGLHGGFSSLIPGLAAAGSGLDDAGAQSPRALEEAFLRRLATFLSTQPNGSATVLEVLDAGLRIPKAVLAGRRPTWWYKEHLSLWSLSYDHPMTLTLMPGALEALGLPPPHNDICQLASAALVLSDDYDLSESARPLDIGGAVVALQARSGYGSCASTVVRRLHSADLSRQLVRVDGGGEAHPLAAVLPAPPTAQQWREACRELAGRLLRGEAEHVTAAELRSVCERLAVLQRCAAELPAPGQPVDAARRKALERVLAAPVMDEPTWELWRQELGKWRWDAERAAELAATGGPVEPRPEPPPPLQPPQPTVADQRLPTSQQAQTAACGAALEEGATGAAVEVGVELVASPVSSAAAGPGLAAAVASPSPGPGREGPKRCRDEAGAGDGDEDADEEGPVYKQYRSIAGNAANHEGGREARNAERPDRGRSRERSSPARSPSPSTSRSSSSSSARSSSPSGSPARRSGPRWRHRERSRSASPRGRRGSPVYAAASRDWPSPGAWAADVHRFLLSRPAGHSVPAGFDVPSKFRSPFQSLASFLRDPDFRTLWTVKDQGRLELLALPPPARAQGRGGAGHGGKKPSVEAWAADVYRHLLTRPGHTIKVSWLNEVGLGLDRSFLHGGTTAAGFLSGPDFRTLWTVGAQEMGVPLRLTALPGALGPWLAERKRLQEERRRRRLELERGRKVSRSRSSTLSAATSRSGSRSASRASSGAGSESPSRSARSSRGRGRSHDRSSSASSSRSRDRSCSRSPEGRARSGSGYRGRRRASRSASPGRRGGPGVSMPDRIPVHVRGINVAFAGDPALEAWATGVHRFLISRPEHTAVAADLRSMGLGVRDEWLGPHGGAAAFYKSNAFQDLWTVSIKMPMRLTANPGALEPWLQRRRQARDPDRQRGQGRRSGRRNVQEQEDGKWASVEEWAEDVHRFLMSHSKHTATWSEVTRSGFEIPSAFRGLRPLTAFLYGFDHLWTLSDPNRPKNQPLELTAIPLGERRTRSRERSPKLPGNSGGPSTRPTEAWAEGVYRYLLTQPGLTAPLTQLKSAGLIPPSLPTSSLDAFHFLKNRMCRRLWKVSWSSPACESLVLTAIPGALRPIEQQQMVWELEWAQQRAQKTAARLAVQAAIAGIGSGARGGAGGGGGLSFNLGLSAALPGAAPSGLPAAKGPAAAAVGVTPAAVDAAAGLAAKISALVPGAGGSLLHPCQGVLRAPGPACPVSAPLPAAAGNSSPGGKDSGRSCPRLAGGTLVQRPG
ncbi:hypothetical protein HYH03_004758 [Edaphochlamys debaryana]|uniref:Uncharacterized protein n=1 Tax=Edaphochlamys debaryana TaxID=47281 RepID=A0A835Y9D3_9CHLO|nr:hypothetical protein HYH03_004758 [Edaphochlamys debaryana]|eukprot:KAG2497168.1 hypothetical protein HYH03_004758 [Edaphochlamys debaryana]